jgi:hypothetical protein
MWRVKVQNTSIRAHFDGQRILLDEPFEIEPNAQLLITVLPTTDADRDSWLQVSAERLAAAFGEDEPEYSLSSVQETNPDYE